MRVRSARGSLVVVCADDLAAAEYSSRLPFGAGRPVRLDEESATGLARRRRGGAQEAEQAPGKFYRQEGITHPIAQPHGVEPVVQLPAVNTEHRPWASPGGISGARCRSFADAAHVREVIVSEHLHEMEGMVVIFGDAQAAVVAVIADTPETSQLAHAALLRLASNLSYEPSPEEAWALWATRLQAGSAPFPISVDGTAKEAMAFLTGSVLPPGARLHPPSRATSQGQDDHALADAHSRKEAELAALAEMGVIEDTG
jgi:hypothetical protein